MRIIHERVDHALLSEWQRRWDTATTGRRLYDVVDRVGGGWSSDDAEVALRADVTMVACFVTGHFHFGDWSPSRDPDAWDECPLCGGDFSRSHILWDCETVSEERRALLGDIIMRRGEGFGWIVRHAWTPLGRFLRAVRRLVQTDSE